MSTHTKRDGVCLLPPSIPGSVGDEKAMITCVQQTKGERLVLLNYEEGSWDFVAPGARSISQFGKLNSTSYYKASGLRKLASIAKIASRFAANVPVICLAFLRSKRFIILGMDIMDGHYGVLSAMHKITLAYVAAFLGVKVDIINCSFNEHPSRVVAAALRWLPRSVRIVAREKQSLARMEKFLRRPIALSADVVFLMDPTLPGANPLREHIEWIEERKREGKRAIALNLADNHNYPLDALVDACAETIRKSPDACFVLIPHAAYARPNLPNENVLMERVLSKLSPADAARCRLIRLPFDPRALQEVLGHIDFGICGRMHLAIGLLSAGVPASCIGYQNKFDGLLVEYLRMPELLLDMEAVFAKGDFGDVLRAVLPSATDYSERIRAELPELRRMAAKNFAD